MEQNDGTDQPILAVVFYRTEAGNQPVRDWLKELAREDRKIIGEDIKAAQYGWPLGMPLIKKLEPGIWEVRSRVRQGMARVLFTVEGNTMVLLHGSSRSPRRRRAVILTRRASVWRTCGVRMRTMNKKHIGDDFDAFLREERLSDACEATAAKRVIAFQIAQEMKRRKLTKSQMANRMKTSRAALERLLDPSNVSVTLSTLERAASALGKRLRVEMA